MKSILYDEIPSLNLSDFYTGDASQKQKFVATLGAAFTNIGFVSIRNHFLEDDLQNRLYAAIQNYFTLADDVKKKYERTDLAGQRGYVSKGKEHAKGRNTGDLKEFYHIGQELSPNDLLKEGYPENIWPIEIPEFKPIAIEVYRALEMTGLYMLRAIALYLNLDEFYFDDKVKNGNSILRPIHYYPIEYPDSIPADAVRAAAHGDINLITLLMGATADGLQVLRKDDTWIPITALPDQLIVNVGDMLERLTHNKLKSTIHRVVNPPRKLMNTPRYSVPFFMHPRSEMNLSLPRLGVETENTKDWSDISAGEFLDQRLREIGLKK